MFPYTYSVTLIDDAILMGRTPERILLGAQRIHVVGAHGGDGAAGAPEKGLTGFPEDLFREKGRSCRNMSGFAHCQGGI